MSNFLWNTWIYQNLTDSMCVPACHLRPCRFVYVQRWCNIATWHINFQSMCVRMSDGGIFTTSMGGYVPICCKESRNNCGHFYSYLTPTWWIWFFGGKKVKKKKKFTWIFPAINPEIYEMSYAWNFIIIFV